LTTCRLLTAIGGSLLLFATSIGCSMTLPVRGEMEKSGERFLGEATGYMTGKGKLTIRLQAGTSCDGTFQYASSGKTGQGGFNCADGRTGDFFFTSNGTEGEGFGKTTDGQMFRFRFGGPEYTAARQQQWQGLARSFDQMSRQLNPPTSYCSMYGNSMRCTHYNMR
jgi:hypothetical protein